MSLTNASLALTLHILELLGHLSETVKESYSKLRTQHYGMLNCWEEKM